MGLGTSLADYLKKKLHKHENITNILKMEHTQNQGIHKIVLCSPWSDYFINNQRQYQNIYNKTKMTSC